MKLTKQAALLLDALNTAEPDLQGRFYTVDYAASLSDTEYDNAYITVQYLHDMRCVEFADKQKTCFRILEQGKNYKEICRGEKKTLWSERLWSFVAGVASGAIVARVTDIISWLCSLFTSS